MRYIVEVDPGQTIREEAGTLDDCLELFARGQGSVRITDRKLNRKIYQGSARHVEAGLIRYVNTDYVP